MGALELIVVARGCHGDGIVKIVVEGRMSVSLKKDGGNEQPLAAFS